MEQTKAFYDLCIPHQKDEKLMKAIVAELIDLGYKTMAIEQVFDHTKKDNIKRGADIFPEPVNLTKLQEEFKNQIRIIQRITIVYVDTSITHAMTTSSNLKKFNIIAGQPKTDAALTHCCTTFNGDLVTFDPDAGIRLLVNRKAFQVAIKRGIFFEIKYAPAITDSNNRKDMIRTAHNYNIRGKSKSIIFSSGAKSIFELRGPYDVANLSYIFGMSSDQGKNAIDKFCRQLFLRAESRRLGKTIMFVKSSGPIVFSDSSCSEDEDDEEMEANQSDENQSPTNSENDMEELNERPSKKQKMNR